MSLAQVIRFVTSHPVNRRRLARGLPDFVAWQLRSRFSAGPHIHRWIGGTRFWARRGETGITGNIYTGLHEFEDMAFALHVLRPGTLFVDVGANAGTYTLLASGVVGCHSVALEPVPEAFARLQANLSLNGLHGVEAVNVAAGERAGRVIFTAKEDTTNHALAPDEESNATVPVEVRTLDEVLAGRAVELLKIDVEGFELPVLQGAPETISRTNCVLLELNGSGARYGWHDGAVAEILFDAGFSAYRYRPFERRLERTGRELRREGNTLFVRDAARAAHLVASSRQYQVKGIAL